MTALSGIRVVEAGEGVGLAYCGKLLAALGASVIKLEPAGGDRLRQAGPFPGDRPDPERSGLFLHLNTGKRSVRATLADAATRERTVAGCDVLLLGYGPSELVALGIDLASLRKGQPGLVVACVSTFGLDGPYADFLGGELVAYAVGGYMLLTGSPDRQPIKSYGHLVEYQAGAQGALGAFAALEARDAIGHGQVVDVSAAEAATFMLGGVEQQAYFYGRVIRRNGTRLLGYPPEYPYPSTIRPCREGFVHCHSNNRHLDLLGALIGDPRLLEPELLATMMGHADEIDAILDDWLAGKTKHEAVALAQELRLPFTEVLAPAEVLADAHFRERGCFVTVPHASGPVEQPGAPFRFSGVAPPVGPAPLLGECTLEEAFPAAARARPGTRAPATGGPRPLSGVRVVDFTNAVAGPIASSLLGTLGADVIKVEAPTARSAHGSGAAPLAAGGEDRPYDRVMNFNALNHGKRGVGLDVACAEGRDLFLRLVAVSDVLVQNFAPRVLGNLGLEYEKLRAVNPGIVLVSMPAFGLSGPYRDRGSYGPGIDAMSGLAHLTGYADGPPMKPGNFFCDQQAGVLAALATLAALRRRRERGQGEHVELAMIDGEFQVVADAYLDYAWNGRERARSGNDLPPFAPHDAYRCRGTDAWVAIGVENDAQWRALCDVIGQPGLATDPLYAGAESRWQNRESLRPILERWTSERTHYAAQAALQSAGVPAGAVLDSLELLSDPHVVARGTFEYVDVPNVGPTPYPRPAFTLSDTPVPLEKAAPGFGEDNEAVFGGLLGLSRRELQELESAGIAPRVPFGVPQQGEEAV